MVRVLSESEDTILVTDTHTMELSLAQFEVSDSEAGSHSSFELLLPDFSSLAISDVINKENCPINETAASDGDGATYCHDR